MAKVFLVYGPRGGGKTTTTLQLADALAGRGLQIGGYFQQTTSDELERRGYDLVRLRDRAQTIALARPGGTERAGESAVCSFSFSHEAFCAGLEWLKMDADSAQVLVMDEISKLEVRGEGHAAALRWALGLGDDKVLLLSVRGDQLYYVVETFGLEERLAGYLEIPAQPGDIESRAEEIAGAIAMG